jgi:deoxyribose-phosphate aldolase
MNLHAKIEHCLLTPSLLLADIHHICNEAKQYQFRGVCIPPLFVKNAKNILQNSGIQVATVVGFPFGYNAIESKVAETVLALIDGADEIQLMANTLAIKNNDWQFLANELNTVLSIISNKNKTATIIIESDLLTEDELSKCCDLYGIAGVNYIKTATGFGKTNSSFLSTKFIRTHLADEVGIIICDDIKNFTFAKQFLDFGATLISCNAKQLMLDSIQQN